MMDPALFCVKSSVGCALVLLCAIPTSIFSAPLQQSRNPQDFVNIEEIDHHNKPFPLSVEKGPNFDVDLRSSIQVRFNHEGIAPPDDTGEERVLIRVEAFLIRGGTEQAVLSVESYVSYQTEDSSPQIVYHDKPYRPPFFLVPPATVNLRSSGIEEGDIVALRITNLTNLEKVTVYLSTKRFGLRQRTLDSFLFVRRLDVSDEDEEKGVDPVRFLPTPGVTHHFQWYDRGSPLLRALHPSLGINVSFTKWDDLAVDTATGAAERAGSDVQITIGLVLSFFNNLISASIGWNPYVESESWYWGIGFSFVDIVTRGKRLVAE